VARLKQRGDEAGLREYLLEEAVKFRDLYGRLDERFWEVLSQPVDRLLGGEPYGFYRYELPDDHPLRLAAGPGGMCDWLVLTEHDELVPAAPLPHCGSGSVRGLPW
jgi:hypothetical protein